MSLVVGGVNICGIMMMIVCFRLKRMEILPYFNVPYLLNQSIATVCVYKGWLPNSWISYPKEVFELQLIVNFIMLNAIPLADFKITLFLLYPILLVSASI